ncbi:hypothetical protein AB0N07_33925 [Streptomyces sp. NPDC051172]|uniref:hypothetical protein n=1 Tax=Streptomyces sp. NPDC051172 TaxID=3155796 RepID=UPI00344663FD
MTSPMRPPPQWIARYFIDPPNPADLQAAQLKMWLGGPGAALGLVLLFAAGGGAAVLGFVMLVAGAIVGIQGWNAKRVYDAAYAQAVPRPSDTDIDQLIGMDSFSIMNRSLPQLGLTADDLVAPRAVTGAGGASFDDIAAKAGSQGGPRRQGDNQLMVWGPAFPCRMAIGDDGRMRYSRYEFMVICPTHYQLAIYRCELDLFSGQLQSEQTHEYHYKDVVAVRTASVPLYREGISITPRPSQVAAFARYDTVRRMEIIVSSGDRSSITLRVSSAADVTVDSNDALDFPQVLERVRATLREKKGGTYQPNDDLI